VVLSELKESKLQHLLKKKKKLQSQFLQVQRKRL
jgi:hypothetical protein